MVCRKRFHRRSRTGTLIRMSDADVAEILKLSPEERLRLVEIIWESLAADPSSVPLGDAHRAVIDERLAEEFLAASNNEGVAIKKKQDTHRMAEANRAFAHFSW